MDGSPHQRPMPKTARTKKPSSEGVEVCEKGGGDAERSRQRHHHRDTEALPERDRDRFENERDARPDRELSLEDEQNVRESSSKAEHRPKSHKRRVASGSAELSEEPSHLIETIGDASEASENEGESISSIPSIDRKLRPVKEKQARKAHKPSKSQRQSDHTSSTRGTDVTNESEEYTQFINKNDLPHLPKIEPTKGSQFTAATYRYRKPISTFRVR